MSSPYRVDVGTRPRLLCQMVVSLLWVARQAQAVQPTQRLRFSLGLPVVARWFPLTSSSGRARTISTHSLIFSLAVAYLLVSQNNRFFWLPSLTRMGRVSQ